LNGPVQIFTAITLIALPTVMFGGFSLLRLLIGGRLNEFQLTYFRAGHAHAGVLLVLTLVVLDLLTRTNLSRSGQWIVGALLLAGGLAQSGGMFLHMGIGKPGRWSAGNSLTTFGAVLLAAAMLTTAVAVIAS
jgi:heme/copper-type cytochrome/quinol oxidase subunit 4